MTTWESGRESSLLDDIIAAHKTIEGRLNRGKFAQYKIGDTIQLRRDVRNEDGVLEDGAPDAARVSIVDICSYPDFLSLVTAEGYRRIIPSARSAAEAAAQYNSYYTTDDQKRFGVLAIEIKLEK